MVVGLCNLKLRIFSFLYVQFLHNNCSHIEDVHLLFCAHLIDIFLFLRGVKLRHFSIQNAWGLVCVICNSYSYHSFILKLVMMIVHALKMCTFYFVHV